MKRTLIITSATLMLSACISFSPNGTKTTSALPSAQTGFFKELTALCGKSFAGKLVSTDDTDKKFGKQTMMMEVRECTDTTIRIPFHVGTDHSRTWVISKTADGLRLKHDHRHEDGSEDKLSQYGGDTDAAGTSRRQTFPADAYSKEMFTREGIAVSNANVWAVEVDPGNIYAYELRRPERFFRVEFDLTAPIQTPPAPWGSRD